MARGHSVTVVAHRPHNAGPRERLGGVEILRISCFANRYVYTFAAMLWVALRRPQADVIHTTTFNAAPAAWLAGRLRRISVVMTVNETWIGKWRSYTCFSVTKAAVHDLLERAVFRFKFDAYVAISKATATHVSVAIPHARTRLQTIYYGFDPTPWRAVAADSTVREALGLAGRFVVFGYGRPGTSKGFEWFVDSIPAIERAIPRVAFIFVLSDDSQYTRELAELKRRAYGHALFLPPQAFAKLVRLMKMADCVVVPSLAEGFGYTTLEAVAAGVPVVASRTGSIPEVIGGRFLLVEPRDAVGLAGALSAIERGEGERGPERTFRWSDTIDAYEAIYRRLRHGEISVAKRATQRA